VVAADIIFKNSILRVEFSHLDKFLYFYVEDAYIGCKHIADVAFDFKVEVLKNSLEKNLVSDSINRHRAKLEKDISKKK
jgi:hypothetical protein